MRKKRNGFSLLESLLSLSLFFIILVSSLEFFGFSRNIFLKLTKEEKTEEAVSFALDKIRIDLLDSGRGLSVPLKLGLLEGISDKEESLTIYCQEDIYSLSTDLSSGQERITFDKSHNIKKGREICIFDSEKGEVKSVSPEDRKSIVLSSPLHASYTKDISTLVLLQKISFFLDQDSQTLRRKVNASSPQPLLEDVVDFGFHYDRSANLIKLSLTLKENKERRYEISVFPKNMALANTH